MHFKLLVLILLTGILVIGQDTSNTIHRRHISLDFEELEKGEGNWLKRAAFSEPVLFIDSTDFQFAFTPIWDFQAGKSGELTTMQNTRGALVQGQFFKKLTFASAVFENQSVVPEFINVHANQTYVFPGGARTKSFKDNGYDYFYATSYVNYKANKYFNAEIGHGKNFIGEGYRSLLLSDNAFNYPYIKLTSSFWKIRYTNLYAELMDIYGTGNADQLFSKKYFATHTLDFDVTKWLTLGVFETVVWGQRGFELNYINPIIFFRAVEFSVGSPDNVMMGLNLKANPIENVTIYGQVILDEFLLGEIKAQSGWWANKYGGQFGVKAHDLFGIENLFIRGEYNIVRPFTYTHADRINNYGHYNYSLAHPLGANFKETVGQLGYQFKNIYADVKLTSANYGTDSLNAVLTNGGDIFRSYNDHANEYGNFIGQGISNQLNTVAFKIGYIINPSIKMRAEVSLFRRSHTILGETTTQNWISFGFKSMLPSRYFDFL